MRFAWQKGNKKYMNQDLTAKPPEYLPANESRHFISANVDLNTFFFPGFPPEIGLTKKDEEVRTQQRPFFHLHASPPTPNLYPNEQLFAATHELGIPLKRKFFIFDHSGAETRMILSSLKPPIANPAAKSISEYNSEQFNDSCKSHEDHITGGEGSEFHEDTEELNALLYSDNDDISCDSIDEDEVSTGRSPFALENGFDDTKQGEDSDDEVTSWVQPPKRHKPLSFGSSNKLSSMAAKPVEKQSPQFYKDDKQSASFGSSIKHSSMATELMEKQSPQFYKDDNQSASFDSYVKDSSMATELMEKQSPQFYKDDNPYTSFDSYVKDSSMATEPMEKRSPQLYFDEEHSLSFYSSNKPSSMATGPLEKLSLLEKQSVSFDSSNKLSSMATKPMEDLSVRAKIRNKLSVLEYLVPGSKGKDPLLILEETIEYLKHFKENKEDNPERRGCCGPRRL